ncbi:hypothetical protein, conserved, partial [Eimeria maxima]
MADFEGYLAPSETIRTRSDLLASRSSQQQSGLGTAAGAAGATGGAAGGGGGGKGDSSFASIRNRDINSRGTFSHRLDSGPLNCIRSFEDNSPRVPGGRARRGDVPSCLSSLSSVSQSPVPVDDSLLLRPSKSKKNIAFAVEDDVMESSPEES